MGYVYVFTCLPADLIHAARNSRLSLSGCICARVSCCCSALTRLYCFLLVLDSGNSVTIVNVGSKFNLNPSPTLEFIDQGLFREPVFIAPDY